MWRPCLDCGQPALDASRCPVCTSKRKRIRNQDAKIAKAVIAASPMCARCGATQDLTADHVVPLAAGGTNEGERQTLCRSCNSRKGAWGD